MIRTLLLLNLLFVSAVSAQDYRSWNTSNGQRTRVKLAAVEVVQGSVRFKRQDDGREFTFPLRRLSQEDQQTIREQFQFDESDPQLTGGNESNSLSGVQWDAPVLTDQNLDQWVDYLWPTEKDLVWRNIRWHNNLGDAIKEARRLQRPILLWTMNGNPCGET